MFFGRESFLMKIGLFTQNVRKGGLDTFIVNLLGHWSEDQEAVLFCNQSHPGLAELRKALSHRVEIVAYDFLIAQDLAEQVSGLPAPARAFLRALFWLLGFPYMVWQIRRLFRRHPCERMMVVNGGYPGGDACLAATLAWAGLGNGQPRAWHNFHNLTLPYPQNPLRSFKERWIDRRVAQSAAGLVTVSAACLATLRERLPLLGLEGRFIHNGVEPLETVRGPSLRAELCLPESSRLVLMLAVYEARKGHAFIFEAMQTVVANDDQAYLLVCGDGSESEMTRVQQMLEDSPCCNRIILQGYRRDVGNLLAQADVLAIPSQAQESFGYSAIEAMFCGLPVVATDVGGLPEVVEHGRTGLIVARDDATGFGRALGSLLSDPARREALGEAGRVRARERFCVGSMAAQYRSLLE